MEKSKEKEYELKVMERFLKESGQRIYKKGMELYDGKMEENIEEIGKIEK